MLVGTVFDDLHDALDRAVVGCTALSARAAGCCAGCVQLDAEGQILNASELTVDMEAPHPTTMLQVNSEAMKLLHFFVPASVRERIASANPYDLRTCTILFCNLPPIAEVQSLEQLGSLIRCAQNLVHRHDGQIKQILQDDKVGRAGQ